MWLAEHSGDQIGRCWYWDLLTTLDRVQLLLSGLEVEFLINVSMLYIVQECECHSGKASPHLCVNGKLGVPRVGGNDFADAVLRRLR